MRRLREPGTGWRERGGVLGLCGPGRGQLLGFAFLLTGNRHDAEDLVPQALLRTAARWTAAAMILAADALSAATGGAGLFREAGAGTDVTRATGPQACGCATRPGSPA